MNKAISDMRLEMARLQTANAKLADKCHHLEELLLRSIIDLTIRRKECMSSEGQCELLKQQNRFLNSEIMRLSAQLSEHTGNTSLRELDMKQC